jgi:hypothetical protein
MRQISERAPVALDRLKAPEAFALPGRKTGNECGPLTPFADDIRCKRSREADSNTDGKTCPEHAWIIVPLRGDFAAAWFPSLIYLERELHSRHNYQAHLSAAFVYTV